MLIWHICEAKYSKQSIGTGALKPPNEIHPKTALIVFTELSEQVYTATDSWQPNPLFYQGF